MDGDGASASHAPGDPPLLWTLHVKQGATSHAVNLPPTALTSHLQERLEQLTGVLSRQQKLIHKGKCLDPARKLADQGVGDGAKLMLLQGDGKARTTGQQAAQVLLEKKQAAPQRAAAGPAAAAAPPGGWPERRRTWAKTNIVALRELGLTQLPEDLFDATLTTATVADISLNQLSSLPSSLALLVGLHTLKLGSNALTDAGVPWDSLCGGAMASLAGLHLDGNQLTTLPAALAGLASLRRLSAASNRLTSLAPELAGLSRLELLLVDDNLLEELPHQLGCCSELVELSACRNRITEVPAQLAALKKLATLRLDDNRIRTVPAALLTGCVSLSLLSLATNPVTGDQLRDVDGWAEYDARRRSRCDKAIDMSVLTGGGFTDGGADRREWVRWAAPPAPPGSR